MSQIQPAVPYRSDSHNHLRVGYSESSYECSIYPVKGRKHHSSSPRKEEDVDEPLHLHEDCTKDLFFPAPNVCLNSM